MAYTRKIEAGRTYCKILGWKKFGVRKVIEVDRTGPCVMVKWLRGGRRTYTKDGILLWNMSREDVFQAWADFEDVSSRE